ncbi:Tex family protein [Actinomycetospora soli]|uniref:Tex family protein n=1 Tax=Actinomycetospora soli TaxID=2893887 RepID=UPI001E56FC78|nr:Tex family protein [Actinomycetospora soli]MCD2189074.1 RNA-binding transcriptional accessory protein [Actinomycetospora soli]
MTPVTASLPAQLPPVPSRIASELEVGEGQVRSAIELLDGGATVPFVARYRKEATGGLDDAQLRTLHERLGYLRELEERRTAVVDSVREQGKLTDELHAQLLAAETKSRLEDVYLPYKPKRRTKAMIAREAGLEPLADGLLGDPTVEPRAAAAAFVDPEKGVADADAALEGARAILVERLAEDADLVGELRERMWTRGRLTAVVREGKADDADAAKFSDYFAFDEPFTKLPSHRILALLRGETEEVLQLTFDPCSPDDDGDTSAYEGRIASVAGIADRGRPADSWLLGVARWAWRTRISSRLAVDLRVRLREVAEEGAVGVFAGNLRDLLLAAPAGARPTMGLDPGLRTGVKVAVVDGTGKVVAHDTIYPHVPRNQWDASLATLARLAAEHRVELVAIGNGTASRETHKLAVELAKLQTGLIPAMVSEAGASVYSASEEASKELPDLDVSIRGAVSIARRLQDPLAELVKIDPKSIGVGQYQHDVSGTLLSRSLDGVVEDCVNAVGVDVNTASAPLLRRVSGISSGLATTIVGFRDEHGPFASRTALTKVPRLGAKAFEQCAGFLRIPDATDPLDRSGVHPEAYPVVRRIVERTGADVASLVGNSSLLGRLDPRDFTDDTFGVPTVTDIIAELDKPGRDPRPAFETATFAEGVEKITDLNPGMVLEGVVTNVAAFGAFVDVGVHQDGLVHISAMSKEFVSDPRAVVGPGDVVRVKVLEVDVPRKRISLTLRLDDEPGAGSGKGGRDGGAPRGGGGQPRGGGQRGGQPKGGAPQGQQRGGSSKGRGNDRDRRPAPGGAMADALRRAGFDK